MFWQRWLCNEKEERKEEEFGCNRCFKRDGGSEFSTLLMKCDCQAENRILSEFLFTLVFCVLHVFMDITTLRFCLEINNKECNKK